jgi:NAD(P)-dependent dehydrogenase (short-subunit alcohol dehydrogenase family)
MKEFAGRTAVVTGGGSGMGRTLVRQLKAEAGNVAMCNVSPVGLAETKRLCDAAGLPQGLRVTTHIADVADRTQVERFRDEVADRHQTDKIHLLFNNAGISGGGSMVTNSRDERERTFNICWGGVYNCTRAFLPMLQNAEESHIVNTSSINGFWASVGPRRVRPAMRPVRARTLSGMQPQPVSPRRIRTGVRYPRLARQL